MKFLKENTDDLMLCNMIYNRPCKEYEYKSSIDVVLKNMVTGEKFVKTIEEPKMDIFFTKPEFRDYKYNRHFMRKDKLIKKTVKARDVEKEIAKEAGGTYSRYYENARKTNYSAIRNMHKYPYVFASDYPVEDYYRIQWLLEHENHKLKRLHCQYLDIEVDGIDVAGFPKDGECPINAVTVVDDKTMSCHTFLLRNNENPQIAEFESKVDDFIKELHEDFDDIYGKLDYNIYMYDEQDELKMITDIFKYIHMLKADFVLIWNIPFDMPFIISRIEVLGGDYKKILTHPDFSRREARFVKDFVRQGQKKKDMKDRTDHFEGSCYSVFLDQMILYAITRKGGGELRSIKLNDVGKFEINDAKLDYSEFADIKTLPYENYWLFVKYNIKDVLLQMGINKKTHDTEALYEDVIYNATNYVKAFKQTVFLKNLAYVEFSKQGFIPGNNVNIEYDSQLKKMVEQLKNGKDDEDDKYGGALVGDSELNTHTGIDIMGLKSKYIYKWVVDMDFSSMYPNIIIVLNICAETLVGKLVVNDFVPLNRYNEEEYIQGKYDAGKDFMESMLVGNIPMMGKTWFNLPSYEKIVDLAKAKLGVDNMKNLNVSKDKHVKYFADKVIIEVDIKEVC